MTRRRFTGDMEDVSGSLFLVERPVAVEIVSFWRYDLKDGSLPFTWQHPLTEEAATYLFLSPPKPIAVSGDLWRMALRLRKLP